MRVMLYLLLTFVWAIAGVGLLLWHWLDPQADQPVLRWTGISAGWLCLALAAYNLVRWWSGRELRRQDRTWAQTQAPAQRFSTIKPTDAPDPEFDFNAPPADEGTPHVPSVRSEQQAH